MLSIRAAFLTNPLLPATHHLLLLREEVLGAKILLV
jgi:hypothetical protein